MSRYIYTHISNSANAELKIVALDQPGAGGACQSYLIGGFNTSNNPSKLGIEKPTQDLHILFQNGPIPEVGVNGVTNEALMAILIDRLEHFQAGPYSCEENQHALDSLRRGLDWLRYRTQNRRERGVEGTHEL